MAASPGIELRLSAQERDLLDGESGEAVALAMRVLTRTAEALRAERLIAISSAHIDSCLYHGDASVDFAVRLAELGAEVQVPTTLNVSSLDLLHPELFRGPERTSVAARRLMDAYVEMGCTATWTCAPYQLPRRPDFGETIAWAESNAIVFANSVLGARTDRYGDFIDICAAIVGRVPEAGLHREENRVGETVFDVGALSEELRRADIFYAALGNLIGKESGPGPPVIVGLPATTTEDDLKALGATAASSGSVAMFHAVGITPEAPTLEAALGDRPPQRTVVVSTEVIRAARDALGALPPGTELDAVSVGTPHFSLREFALLDERLRAADASVSVPFYVSTSRFVLEEAQRRGLVESCERAGVTLVTDTCTYVTPILDPAASRAMTNSGKWAYYAPANLGITTAFGSLEECVLSAVAGRVVRSDELWS